MNWFQTTKELLIIYNSSFVETTVKPVSPCEWRQEKTSKNGNRAVCPCINTGVMRLVTVTSYCKNRFLVAPVSVVLPYSISAKGSLFPVLVTHSALGYGRHFQWIYNIKSVQLFDDR